MNDGKQKWTVRLSRAATADFRDILQWSEAAFGHAQALRYEGVLTDAIDALTAGPKIAGSRARGDLMPELLLLHVARNRHRGRHVLLYKASEKADSTIEILRLLHDSMDFARHLPETENDAP